MRRGWNCGQFWWMLLDDWFSSGEWWVCDTLLLLLPYCRLGEPQWFASAVTVRWSVYQQSFGIQVCRIDINRGDSLKKKSTKHFEKISVQNLSKELWPCSKPEGQEREQWDSFLADAHFLHLSDGSDKGYTGFPIIL